MPKRQEPNTQSASVTGQKELMPQV